MWPLDIVKKRKQALLKHRRILYYSLGGCVVVAGVTGTVLGILLTKPKQTPTIVMTKITDLSVGDDLANKFLLMPKIGWCTSNSNWPSSDLFIAQIMDFNIRKGLSHNTHIFYKFDMSDKYDEAEYFCYGKGFSIDETPSATICKRLIPGTTMSWNEDYRDLSKNICGDYYYLELSSSIPLIISNIYSDTLTPEFRVFLSNCCIADKI